MPVPVWETRLPIDREKGPVGGGCAPRISTRPSPTAPLCTGYCTHNMNATYVLGMLALSAEHGRRASRRRWAVQVWAASLAPYNKEARRRRAA